MKPVAYNAMALCEPVTGVSGTMRGLLGAFAAGCAREMLVYAPRHLAAGLPSGSGLHIRPCGWPGPSRAMRILWEQLLLPARLGADGAALLHAPAYVAPLGAPCPFVLTVHDLHVFTHPHCCTAANRLHYRLLLPSSIRRAAAIVVYSEHVRRTLAARYPDAAPRIAVIPPGVDSDMRPASAAARQAAIRQYGLPESFLLFVGDLAPRKNLPRLLEAFGTLARERPELHLLLAGRALRGDRRLARALSAPGLAGRVHILGYVPRPLLPAIYSLAAALVYPSYDEGFGLPVLEAMACGCPVVTSACGGPAEICGDAAVYCDAQHTSSIADAMRAPFNDMDGSLRRVAAGIRRAAAFTWAHAAERTLALYETCLK